MINVDDLLQKVRFFIFFLCINTFTQSGQNKDIASLQAKVLFLLSSRILCLFKGKYQSTTTSKILAINCSSSRVRVIRWPTDFVSLPGHLFPRIQRGIWNVAEVNFLLMPLLTAATAFVTFSSVLLQ